MTAIALDDDAEWLRDLMHGCRVNSDGGICLGWTNLERLERIAARLSVTTPDTTVLVEALTAATAALRRLTDRHGGYINELPGATGVSDLAFAADALVKAASALASTTNPTGES